MSSTNKTTYYELSQYIGTDKPTYLGDYNSDMLAIDTAIHEAAQDAGTAVSTANTANATATTASSNASTALSTANSALETANSASTTATTASNNASAALAAASAAETAAAANTITNLAPAYDPTLTYTVGDLVTYIDEQGSGKLYKCIVAVSTPEAFNINKWDDVTASELFSQKSSLVASYTTDGTETYLNAYTALFNASGGNFDINSEYILADKFETFNTYKHCMYVSTSELRFGDQAITSTTTNLNYYRLKAVPEMFESKNGTISNFGNDTISARTLVLIKLSTI